MDDLPLRWQDSFLGSALGAHWVGGHANASREATISLDNGLYIRFDALGKEYASAGLVTRAPLVGDFDVRVRFTVSNPAPGTTFELAAIAIDPPLEAALDQQTANGFTRSRVYDVHGAPPYVSSEFDEDDGWRIGWNRGSAAAEPGEDGKPRSDNHFNRYGRSTAPLQARPAKGWLRLLRSGTDWATYRLDEQGLWLLTGEVRRMNLPDAVFVRLAAKHWVKRSEGLDTAAGNQVVFHEFQLRSLLPADGGAEPGLLHTPALQPAQRLPSRLPAEVELVRELRGCRRCPAFGAENLYGPFPQVEVAAGAAPQKSVVRGFAPPEPAALYGCRKAPIMLIGINPNLPGHFIIPRPEDDDEWRSGSYRLVPFFSGDAAYAHHYRFGPEPASKIADERHLDTLLRAEAGSVLVAFKPGKLMPDDGNRGGSFRLPGMRRARLALQYDDGAREVHDLAWEQNQNLAVVRRRFNTDEIIAGRFDAAAIGREIDTVADPQLDGYYRRAGKLLQHVGGWFPQSDLALGEDMSLHDAVACASPRWDAREMPLATIQAHCVREQRWLHRQIEHSNPEVIVLAGRTALELFAEPELGSLSTPLADLPRQAGGREGLFQHIARNGLWWTYRVGAALRKVRLVVAPHFSYGDNLLPHSYFTEAQAAEFIAGHPEAAAWLRQEERIAPVFGTADSMIKLAGDDDPAWRELTRIDAVAVEALKERWIAPYRLLSSAVASELQRQGVALDEQGHLRRSDGPCSFCDNAQWKFEGGCRYGLTGG
jgi:hypothetical protein